MNHKESKVIRLYARILQEMSLHVKCDHQKRIFPLLYLLRADSYSMLKTLEFPK